MSDLEKILNEMKIKLGTAVVCYPENNPPQNVPVYSKSFDEVADDGEYTYFRFLHKNVGYIGVLEGATASQKTLGYLIPSYIEGASENEKELSKNEQLKKILRGESSSMAIYKYATKYSVRNIACFVIALRIDKHMEEALGVLEQYGGNSLDTVLQMSENTCVLIRFKNDDVDDYRSAVDYAEFLVQLLKEELGVDSKAGVGPIVRELKEAAMSYSRAENTLRYADVFEMQGNVHSYREFILVKMLEDFPESKLAEFLAELSDESFKEIFEDEEMLNTAENFLQSSLNVSETSRNLYMHRNTLLYRLDKIEKATGLNIRSFSDAVSFRVLTILHRLLKK